MANAIAESLLALLAGAAPAYAEAKSRRGQESRDTKRTLLAEERVAGEREKERRIRATESAEEQIYRDKVLEGQKEERAATAKYRTEELGIRKSEIADRNEFENLNAKFDLLLKSAEQDKQNAVAILQKQIEGYQTLLQVERAMQGMGGKKEGLTPAEQLQRFRADAVKDILSKDLGKDITHGRLATLFGNPNMTPEEVAQQIQNLFVGQAGEGGDIESLVEAAKALAGGAALTGNVIEPLGNYPRSPVGGFGSGQVSPIRDSSLAGAAPSSLPALLGAFPRGEGYRRYGTNPRLQVLVP